MWGNTLENDFELKKIYVLGGIWKKALLWVSSRPSSYCGSIALKKKYILGGLWGKNHHFLVSGRPGRDETTFKASTTHQVDQNVTKF